jgi:uncharacterized membrane protein YukC
MLSYVHRKLILRQQIRTMNTIVHTEKIQELVNYLSLKHCHEWLSSNKNMQILSKTNTKRTKHCQVTYATLVQHILIRFSLFCFSLSLPFTSIFLTRTNTKRKSTTIISSFSVSKQTYSRISARRKYPRLCWMK